MPYTVKCPECKRAYRVREEPDLPRNGQTGVYLRFCMRCKAVLYHRFFGRAESKGEWARLRKIRKALGVVPPPRGCVKAGRRKGRPRGD